MQPEIRVTETFSNLSAIAQAMRALTEKDVLVGIPEDESGRESGGITNAHLGYIHEFGVPEKNIPPRAHLVPGIEDIQKEAAALLEDAAKKALSGNAGAVETNLKNIGLLGQKAVRARFVKNDWPELSDKTLDARKLVGTSTNKKGETRKKYGKSRRERGRVNPLIDTSQLRKAYTYVIRKKGNSALVVK